MVGASHELRVLGLRPLRPRHRFRLHDDAGRRRRLSHPRPFPGAASHGLINILQRVGGSVGTALLAVILERQITRPTTRLRPTRSPPGGASQRERAPRDRAPIATAFGHTFWWAAGMAVLAFVPPCSFRVIPSCSFRLRRQDRGHPIRNPDRGEDLSSWTKGRRRARRSVSGLPLGATGIPGIRSPSRSTDPARDRPGPRATLRRCRRGILRRCPKNHQGSTPGRPWTKLRDHRAHCRLPAWQGPLLANPTQGSSTRTTNPPRVDPHVPCSGGRRLAIIELLPTFRFAGGRRPVGLPLIALGTFLALTAFRTWVANRPRCGPTNLSHVHIRP